MASVLNLFFDQLKASWEALSPIVDDGSGKTYHAIDTLEDELGLGQHREFYFEHFDSLTPLLTASRDTDYEQQVRVYFHRLHRAHETYVRAVNDEVNELVGAFEATIWSGGVSSVRLVRVARGRSGLFTRTPLRAGGVPRDQVAETIWHFQVRADET